MKNHFTKKTMLERISGWGIILMLSGILFNLQLVLASSEGEMQDGKREISGIITDGTTGEVLPGVTVMINGTTSGATTDISGKYTLNVTDTDVLIYKYIGYVEQSVPVGTQTEINITLQHDVVGLDEVVVVGYGVQKKKLVTGATTQVNSEDIVNSRQTRLESSLQGLTPGMTIVKQSGQPGSDFNISIRGLGSVNGSSPLVLIDGVPGNLNTLNPSDVESVDVLKDAASAAIYGSRAADGVILVTTKKGKSGKPQLSYDFYYGWANAPKKIDMLNAKEYAMIMNEQKANIYPTRPAVFPQEYIDSLGEGTNWQEEAIQTNAPTVNHYLGLVGGNDVSNYSLSLSYTKEKGIYDINNKSNYERMGFRLNSQHKVKKYLTIGENLNYSHRKQRGLGTGNQYNNFLRSLLATSPLIKAYDTSEYDGFGKWKYNSDVIGNPLASMHYNYNEVKQYDDIVGDVYAEVELIKGLKFRTDFGGTINFTNNSTVTDSFTITPLTRNPVPDYLQYMERKFGYNWDNMLTYEGAIGKHYFTLMAGTNAQDNWYFNSDINANAFLQNPNLDPVPSNIVLGLVDEDTVIIKGDRGRGVSRFSIFGRINYNYNEMILLNATIRRDGSSRFGADNRYGTFPSLSVGYVLTKMDFMQTFSSIDFFKIRASWGQNGKEPNLDYRYMATVGSLQRSYQYGSGWQTGISPNIMPNSKLKWEASEQINIGFDSRFLKSFSFNFDWYKKTSKDWIIPVTTAGVSGIAGISTTNPYANAGTVINKGVELELGYKKSLGDLLIYVDANFSYNKNEVTDVPGEIIHGRGSVLFNGVAEIYRIEEGYPIGYFWGYQTDGLFQTQEEVDAYVNNEGVKIQQNAAPGDVKFMDLNGDGILDEEDKTMIGDPNPDYLYGLNLSATYKGLDFMVNFSGQGGNQIVKCYRAEETPASNYTADILDRWTGPGTSNRIPRVTGGLDRNQNWRNFSDLYLEDAGFLKLKTVSIGYDIKSLWKKMPLEQCRIYFSGTNLLTFTKYTGLDPEVGYGQEYDSNGLLQDAYATGVDLGFYPAAKTYLIGLNVKF